MWHIRTHNTTSEMYAEHTRAPAHTRLRIANEIFFQFFFFATWFGVRCAPPLTLLALPPPPFMHFHGLIFSTAKKRESPNRRTISASENETSADRNQLELSHRRPPFVISIFMFSLFFFLTKYNSRKQNENVHDRTYASRTMKTKILSLFIRFHWWLKVERLREERNVWKNRLGTHWTYKFGLADVSRNGEKSARSVRPEWGVWWWWSWCCLW